MCTALLILRGMTQMQHFAACDADDWYQEQSQRTHSLPSQCSRYSNGLR